MIAGMLFDQPDCFANPIFCLDRAPEIKIRIRLSIYLYAV
jgi:hypothetical protein